MFALRPSTAKNLNDEMRANIDRIFLKFANAGTIVRDPDI